VNKEEARAGLGKRNPDLYCGVKVQYDDGYDAVCWPKLLKAAA
jgi:hypothetical protein